MLSIRATASRDWGKGLGAREKPHSLKKGGNIDRK
jgi:hypothetical protein